MSRESWLSVIGDIPHQSALLPLMLLSWRWERRAEWWWLAAGIFGVSWIADTISHFSQPWYISAFYPVIQAALVAAVFLSRTEAEWFVFVLCAVGVAAVTVEGTAGPHILLRTVAWGVVVGIVWPLPIGRLRLALLLMFGGSWLAWVGYMFVPGDLSMGIYQSVRAVSLGMFCWASLSPHPKLRLA